MIHDLGGRYQAVREQEQVDNARRDQDLGLVPVQRNIHTCGLQLGDRPLHLFGTDAEQRVVATLLLLHGHELGRDDARIGFISENASLWEATEADLVAAAKIANARSTFAERVRGCFVEAFAISEPNIAYVCDRLHVSRTTLLRRLRAEGTSFQQLLEETRRTLAMRYLTKSDLTNQQIAHLVGYVDPNAFQRAFKRWTGATPQSVRQALERHH